MTLHDTDFAVAAVDHRDPEAPARFTDSLRRTGFGVVRDHPIPRELLESLYAEWLAFFASDAKHAYAADRERHDGFFSTAASETAKTHHRQDLKEYFHVFGWGHYPAEAAGGLGRLFPLHHPPRRQSDRRGAAAFADFAAAVPAAATRGGSLRALHGWLLPRRAPARAAPRKGVLA